VLDGPEEMLRCYERGGRKQMEICGKHLHKRCVRPTPPKWKWLPQVCKCLRPPLSLQHSKSLGLLNTRWPLLSTPFLNGAVVLQ
jgi:hypothetical protein